MLEPSAKAALKSAELEAKKQRVRMWTNFVPPASNSIAYRLNFTGKVRLLGGGVGGEGRGRVCCRQKLVGLRVKDDED